ncbi:MAG TPA: ribbon-helix-helix domain-containing protein [Solirubrobacteraceae bacterium]|nr:ribbon-helix-helix domain-containing protein [Solirubrobacteraceae bacterium]
MSQIAVRLSPVELRQLDAAVRTGRFRSRAEAVRAGIGMLLADAREERISTAYARGYSDMPLTEEETQMLDAAAELAGELPL